MDNTTLVVAVSLLGIVLSSAILIWLNRRQQERDEARLAEATEKGLHIPQSLHPDIAPDACIGCLSCIKACPEGDILGVVDGKAALIAASNCIGHGKCAIECPTNAIKLVFGTSERGVDLPEVNEFFESSRPGVHVVGEVGGMGLIRNAVTQGLQVAEHLKSRRVAGGGRGTVDVAIVGAGPAGLATALGCKAAGLTYRVLEQETLGGTIAHYPRQKVVMTEPVNLPFYGKFGKQLISKESLLETWNKVVAKAELKVEEGVKVTGLEGQDGNFSVLTTRGPVAARKVVLACGRRGSPRKLGVPGEDLPKVSYRLIDPEQYEGSRVLVVGGGDSALEAACSLAEEGGAEVTLSYRGEAFGKCREANRQRIDALIAQKKVRALLPSNVKEIRPDSVTLAWRDRVGNLANDYVIVNAGGELPLEFLKTLGVGLRRYQGEAPGEKAKKAEIAAKARRGSAKRDDKGRDRRFAFALFAIGAIIIAGLAAVGWDYYWLPKLGRMRSPLHHALRPAGPWGHGVGLVATAFMMSNFLYAARKRWSFLKGVAHLRSWLTFHQFVGFMSPLTIAFHAAFQSNNLLATGTAASLGVVVVTGVVGRFIYGLVPTADGRAVDYGDLLFTWERLKKRLEPMLAKAGNPQEARALLEAATGAPPTGSLLGLFLRMPGDALRTRWRLRRLRALFPARKQHEEFRDAFLKVSRLRIQVGFYRSLKRFLSSWRVFHIVLAVFLVVMIVAHIAVSLYLGYGRDFF